MRYAPPPPPAPPEQPPRLTRRQRRRQRFWKRFELVLALIGGGTVVYWLVRGVLTLLMNVSTVSVH